MDIIYVGIIVLFFVATRGLMRICEIPEERKPGANQ